jgi:hypothetical protein
MNGRSDCQWTGRAPSMETVTLLKGSRTIRSA